MGTIIIINIIKNVFTTYALKVLDMRKRNLFDQ